MVKCLALYLEILRVYSKLKGLFLGDSLDSTAGKVCGSD